jgi:hypothetical protein
MKFNFFKYPNFIKLILVLYIVGFAIGTTTHTIGIVRDGFFPYHDVPLWKNIYWTSLTFLDLLAVFLVFKSLIPALCISNLIIISDIIINTKGFQFFNDFNIYFQILFGLYIVITTPIIFLKYRKTVNIEHF